MRTFLEVHVDDVVLWKHPVRWHEAAALVDKLASTAEEVGAALSFRVRGPFAEGDRFNFLRWLVQRGHEVGAHAHGRDLDRAVRALRAAGVEPVVMAPGLVQVGDRGRRALLLRAQRLGARVITDRLESRHFTYQGWLPWAPMPGLAMLDVSVSPFEWGVLSRQHGGVRASFGALDFDRLGEMAQKAGRWSPPRGQEPFFGATFHEHDACPEGSFTPVPRVLDGLARWCARWRPVASATCADGAVTIPMAPSSSARAAAVGAPGNTRPQQVGSPRLTRESLSIAVGQRTVSALRIAPLRPRAAIVVVHAGGSGLVERLGFLGLPDDAFAQDALYLYQRTPGAWRAPGNPVHVADARAVMKHALAEGLPTVVISWSGGNVPAARAIRDLSQPGHAFAAMVDVEGPVDRFSLVPPGRDLPEWAGLSPFDDAPWAQRELIHLLPPCPYIRVQGQPDHVHGHHALHADRLPGLRWDLPGTADRGGDTVVLRLNDFLLGVGG